MRRLSPLFAALCVMPLLGSDSPKEYDDRTDGDELQGKWSLVLQVYDGRSAIAPAVEGSEVETFRAGRWERDAQKGSLFYTTDTSTRPAHLNTQFMSGDGGRGTMRYIYRRNRDTLQIAFGEDMSIRPRSFVEPGIFVVTYKLVK
jgi:uncharacterized protein (TIGR03067 family)